MDENVKKNMEKLCNELGITISAAFNIFARKMIRENGIPFEVKINPPNEVTLAAIQEGKAIINDKTSVGYNNMADLRAALES